MVAAVYSPLAAAAVAAAGVTMVAAVQAQHSVAVVVTVDQT